MPLGPRADRGDARFAGVELPFTHDISGRMQGELLCGFDFVAAPLVDPAYRRPPLEQPPGQPAAPRLRTELMLTSAQWGGQVRARVGFLCVCVVVMLPSRRVVALLCIHITPQNKHLETYT
jgi:protein arginine N-methyltransferase 5